MKQLKMENLDCANCARKMEEAIMKINGVHAVHIQFLTQKMELDYDPAKEKDIFAKIKKACKRIEPDCSIDFA